ncbi:uncharacterized protein LOC115438210 [Sphaeramia orbicularis]|uniref:uncharacterized protein LOC115438210 n=1 Tax=Sphaeramia orbicularis TaxID=375764 RepID=UPI00117FA3EF|nr:uncharacterized protein LOC115438210 [Sphaeramia orbicularis]
MTPPTSTLCLACLILGTMVHLTTLEPSSSSNVKLVTVGGRITLECFYEHSAVPVMFYWYKQALGQKPQKVSRFYKHEKKGVLLGEFQNNSRVTLQNSRSENHLIISDVRFSDSATYYCLSGYSYMYTFSESYTVIVKGSDFNNGALIHQSSSESVHPGDSVTLNCTVHTGTCDGENLTGIHWFKHSKDPQIGVIYTHGGRNDQCERKPDTQTHTCVYNLPIKSVDRTHEGTYYCAVASCGRVLFGNGTRLHIQNKDSLTVVYILAAALAFSTILAAFLIYSTIRMMKTNRCQCSETHTTSDASSPNAEVSDSLHYAALSHIKGSRSRIQRDDTRSECVYSSVQQ